MVRPASSALSRRPTGASADFTLERLAWARTGRPVCGVDEVGRGPLAGPVVAAAVIFDIDAVLPAALLGQIKDSKVLSAKRRAAAANALWAAIRAGTGVRGAIGAASVPEIDRLNILRATLLAMRRAVVRLGPAPALALVDGNRAPDLPCPVECIVGGDARSLSIAAASILAKTLRDRLMARLAVRYPGYGWEGNAGYGTANHKRALDALGVTPHHRRGFKPVAATFLAPRV